MEKPPYPFSNYIDMQQLKLLFLFLSIFSFNLLKSQIHCGLVELNPNTAVGHLVTFDNFTNYLGGITINGAAKIRVKVEDKLVVDPLCGWSLTIIADNGGGAIPATEWERLLLYGAGTATNPTINLLQIRVRNACATASNDGVWQTFPLGTHNDVLDIISPLLPIIIPAGSCAPGVNGPGNHFTNYDEFNFNIDLRISPAFAFNPGIYQLNLRFHLEEKP
jgi:hypothetical protein